MDNILRIVLQVLFFIGAIVMVLRGVIQLIPWPYVNRVGVVMSFLLAAVFFFLFRFFSKVERKMESRHELDTTWAEESQRILNENK